MTLPTPEQIAASMIPPKPALTSTTIWGAILSMAGPFMGPLVTNMLPMVPEQWQPVVSGALSVVGGIIAIYGRNKPDIAPIKGIVSVK